MAFLQTFFTILTVINSSTLLKGKGTLILQNFRPSCFAISLKILHLFLCTLYFFSFYFLSSLLYLPCISSYFQNSWWEKLLMHLHFLVFDFGSSSCSSRILHRRPPPCCRPLWSTSRQSLLTEGDLVVSQIVNCKPLMNRRTDLGEPIIPQGRLRIGLQGRP